MMFLSYQWKRTIMAVRRESESHFHRDFLGNGAGQGSGGGQIGGIRGDLRRSPWKKMQIWGRAARLKIVRYFETSRQGHRDSGNFTKNNGPIIREPYDFEEGRVSKLKGFLKFFHLQKSTIYRRLRKNTHTKVVHSLLKNSTFPFQFIIRMLI